MKPFFQTSALLLLLGFSGCLHSVRVPAPSVLGIRQTVATAKTQVVAAKTNAVAANNAIGRAQISAAKLLRVAPPELREEIQRLRLELDEAHAQIDALTAHLLGADTALQLSQGRIDELEAQVKNQTAALNVATSQLSTLNSQLLPLRALRDQINRLFGIGALFYGVQRLATVGIIGILILAAGAIVLLIFWPLGMQGIAIAGRSLINIFRKPA